MREALITNSLFDLNYMWLSYWTTLYLVGCQIQDDYLFKTGEIRLTPEVRTPK